MTKTSIPLHKWYILVGRGKIVNYFHLVTQIYLGNKTLMVFVGCECVCEKFHKICSATK